MMRKLAIASLLVAGVALSGSVLAQDTSAAPASASTSATTAKHAAHHKSSTHKTHKAKKASSGTTEPASSSTAGK
ncbi:hypothetical protein [Dyella flagellata]|uniref:Uncharacterized protein n=1 Tax=Dyella flagellata TaxID=1867833 RepID=A0ABQ5XF99_9GAMM|nr:hypothetical protein [Dyella flagellata]GLQ90370.1 hypothetical protein GCM10007898_39450 [Dyella flagellata]